MNNWTPSFRQKYDQLCKDYERLIRRTNQKISGGNGIYDRWVHPVVTAAHTPLYWRYDFDEPSNPFLMERLGINATFNTGAMLYNGKYLLMLRVEGNDRKSFFANYPEKKNI